MTQCIYINGKSVQGRLGILRDSKGRTNFLTLSLCYESWRSRERESTENERRKGVTVFKNIYIKKRKVIGVIVKSLIRNIQNDKHGGEKIIETARSMRKIIQKKKGTRNIVSLTSK